VQPDAELDTWRRQWQSHDAVPRDLRRRVEREIRMARVGVVLAVAVTVIFGFGVPTWAILSRRVDVGVLAVGVWGFITINWMVAWSLTRGASKPVATTTAAFLDFSVLSCRRHHQAIVAAAVLYAAFLLFVLAWKYHELAQQTSLAFWPFLTSASNMAVWGITAALAVLAIWRRRKLNRELRNLLRLREQLENSRLRNV
jgi:hypothetical protein